jgi:hypothetical protein
VAHRGRSYARALVAGVIVVVALTVAPAAANASAQWISGPLVESQDVNCIDGFVEQEAGAFLSYYADPQNPPQVGQVYYTDIYMAGLGDPCAGGAYADVNLIMPNGTQPAVSAQNPVKCFFKAPNSSTFSNVASNCPQNLQPGPYGWSLDPTGVNPPFWQLVQGDAVEIQIPVVSNQPLDGTSQLRGYVQLADGQTDPILQPALSMIVNPAGSQNVNGGNGSGGSQIGILYPDPSITSNAQQPNTSTTVGIKGYVENNSNPGHVVAQIAYADSSGDCNSPGSIVYTTPSAALQNPQTLVTGTITGLYADVAYCWRLVASVTSGPQIGTYYGNWEYFVTNGTYYQYANEPPAATPPPSGTNCSANGGGCATSNCTTSSCSTSGLATGAGQQLTVGLAGTGTGSVTDGKYINCPSTCSASYLSGAKVTLTATPGSGSQFAGWSGGGCSGTGTCTVPMTSAQTVTATFTSTTQGGSPGGNVTTTPTLLKSISVVQHQTIRTILKKGLRFQLACGTGCRTTIRLYVNAATAKMLHLGAASSKHKKTPVQVGSATTSLTSAGSKAVTVKLSGKAARAFRKLKHLKLTLNVLVTGGGQTSTKTLAVTLAH